MKITKERRRETGWKTYVTAELSLGDVLLMMGAFVLVVAAVGFGILRIR